VPILALSLARFLEAYPNWFQVTQTLVSTGGKCSCLLLFVTKRKNGRSTDVYTTRGSPPPSPPTLWYQKFEKIPQNISKSSKICTKKIQKFPIFLLILFLVPKENTHTLPTGSDGCDFEIFNEANFVGLKIKSGSEFPLHNIFTKFILFILHNWGLK
jgi:hypothetical protein